MRCSTLALQGRSPLHLLPLLREGLRREARPGPAATAVTWLWTGERSRGRRLLLTSRRGRESRPRPAAVARPEGTRGSLLLSPSWRRRETASDPRSGGALLLLLSGREAAPHAHLRPRFLLLLLLLLHRLLRRLLWCLVHL